MKQETTNMLHTFATWCANTITLTSIVGILPHIATLLAIAWYVCLFIEKRTGKKMETWFRSDE